MLNVMSIRSAVLDFLRVALLIVRLRSRHFLLGVEFEPSVFASEIHAFDRVTQ
jgi:hypothetical protein